MQRLCNLSFGNEQLVRPCVCSTMSLLQQTARFLRRRTRGKSLIHVHPENVATRGIHQGEAIQIAISFRCNRCIIDPKRNPSIIDRKLIGVKHELHSY